MSANSLLSVAKFFLGVALFSVLIVLAGTFFPFIGGKYYFFRTAVEAALGCVVLWWGFQAKPGELSKRLNAFVNKPLFIAVSVFVLIFLLASIFAYDPNAAFWSNYERGEGGFQMLHYYIFFVLSVFLLREDKDWRRMFIAATVAAVGMILYGMGAAIAVQRPGGDFYNPLGWVGPYQMPTPEAPSSWLGRIFQPGNRFQGSLGNPAYVAPHLMFGTFFLIASLLLRDSRPARKDWVWVGALSAFFFAFFAQSNTRGAFLGLVAGILVFLAYLVWQKKEWRRSALITLVALVAIFGALFPFRNNPRIQAIPGARFLTISATERTAQTRIWTWGSAWKGFLDRPLLGWGPENFSSVFDKHFDTRHFIPGENSETWFDRAHSVVFDYLAETGALGLLSYLTMLGVAVYGVLRLPKAQEAKNALQGAENKAIGFFRRILLPGSDVGPMGARGPLIRGLVLAILTAYFVQGLFLFDVLPIYVPLFLTLAFLVREVYNTEKK